jgi:hypothetical protein
MEIDSIVIASTKAPLSNISPNVTTRSSSHTPKPQAKPPAKPKGTPAQQPPAQAHKRRRTADPSTLATFQYQGELKELLTGMCNQINELSTAFKRSEEARIEERSNSFTRSTR